MQTIRLIPLKQRDQVKEITMDFSNNMSLVARCCFPKAIRTIDRFHMQKHACDALQEMCFTHRWDAIKTDNESRGEARKLGVEYKPVCFNNGASLDWLQWLE